MPVDSVAELAECLRRSRLLELAQLHELAHALQSLFPGPRELARELVRRGWLTPHQVNQLFQGRGEELLLGSYVLLEKLGEGGMGQVFKARNWKLGRVVALKLIRKERLGNPDAVRRFHREVRAASQLDHPHIVRALDAGEERGTHYFAMEYAEGTDLARLVKEGGPLPVDRACDCARQAALGLQHAFERGLVHRDVKPHNLLLTKGGVVKVLDMGLARLGQEGDTSGTMTQEGAIMGTPDYVAPEQTLDSHRVDVRADLYSLGCTLYFLLTGKVPFPGGSLGEKLMKHQLREPVPVEERRPGLSPSVAAVVRKLMAKRPEDRFQTPAEAAAALSPGTGREDGGSRTSLLGPAPIQAPADETAGGWSSLETPAALVVVGSPPPRRPARRWVWVGAAGVACLGLVGLLLAIRGGQRPPAPAPQPPAVEGLAPRKEVVAPAWDRWLAWVATVPAERQAEAVAAKLKERNPGFDGKVEHRIEGGEVAGLDFVADNVTDLAPLRALPRLSRLVCDGSAPGKSSLANLSPLKGLPLAFLSFTFTEVADLSPLQGMPLAHLSFAETKVTQLGPLRGMRLVYLEFPTTQVADLAPLKGMPLTHLNCRSTRVASLKPLEGMRLTELNCNSSEIDDLAPLAGMPLEHLAAHRTKITSLAPLRGMPLVRLSIDFTGARDLSPLKGMRLTHLGVSDTKVDDLSPLEGLPLTHLACGNTGITTLAPLKGMRLVNLTCEGTKVADLSPLQGMPLNYLGCSHTGVADLSPLKGMPLLHLYCNNTEIATLAPLKGMGLTHLRCTFTKVTGLSPLKGMPLRHLWCGFRPKRDAEVLRTLVDLEQVDSRPIAEVRREAGVSPPVR